MRRTSSPSGPKSESIRIMYTQKYCAPAKHRAPMHPCTLRTHAHCAPTNTVHSYTPCTRKRRAPVNHHAPRACVRACVRTGVACTVAHAYHAYPCAPPLRACPPRGRRAGAGSQLRRATRQGPGEFVVGCLLSAVSAGRKRAVKAVGGARPLRRCAGLAAHTNTATSAMSGEIDAANKRVLEPQYGY